MRTVLVTGGTEYSGRVTGDTMELKANTGAPLKATRAR